MKTAKQTIITCVFLFFFFHNSYVIIYFYLLLKVYLISTHGKCPFLCNMLFFFLDKIKGLVDIVFCARILKSQNL